MCNNLQFVNYSYFHKQGKKPGKKTSYDVLIELFQNYTATFSSWIRIRIQQTLNGNSYGFETLAVIYLLGTRFSRQEYVWMLVTFASSTVFQ
jgi:hypothetical protein